MLEYNQRNLLKAGGTHEYNQGNFLKAREKPQERKAGGKPPKSRRNT